MDFKTETQYRQEISVVWGMIDQLKAENAALKEQVAQQAEAIRMKDAVLNRIMLNGWGLWALTDIAEALAVQPSPEILQARDEQVAEACAQYVYAMGGAKGSVLLAERLLSGEWRRYL